jgi:hypothetical protein
MMSRFAVAIIAAVLLDCCSAYAQVRTSLGQTSPLGMGLSPPVGQTGIPMGATELATPGVSPGATCGGILSVGASVGLGPSMTGGNGSTLFDGGGTTASQPSSGMTASTPSNCGATGGGPAAPMASSMGPGSSVGTAGIPLGATELGGGGLSPPSVALIPNPSASLMTLAPLTGITPSNPPAPSSTSGSTAPCQTTGTGTPGAGGVVTPFGAPLSGRAFGLAMARCG